MLNETSSLNKLMRAIESDMLAGKLSPPQDGPESTPLNLPSQEEVDWINENIYPPSELCFSLKDIGMMIGKGGKLCISLETALFILNARAEEYALRRVYKFKKQQEL